MAVKPDKYIPTKPQQPQGKRPQRPEHGSAMPYRVASITGQAVGTDAAGWLEAGAGGGEMGGGGIRRGNPVGAQAFGAGNVGSRNASPLMGGHQPMLSAGRLHDILANDPLPSTAVRRPFLFYRESTPTPLAVTTHNWDLRGGEPSLIFQRVAFLVPGIHVTGISTVTNGKHHIFANVGTETGTFDHQNAGSNVGNRLISATGADMSFPAGAYVECVYDFLTGRWRFGPVGASGGGAGVAKESHVVLLATFPEKVCT